MHQPQRRISTEETNDHLDAAFHSYIEPFLWMGTFVSIVIMPFT